MSIIKRLEQEAIQYSFDSRFDSFKSVQSLNEIILEQFSKLIIAECAKAFNDNDFDGSQIGTNILEQHFKD